MLIRRREGEEKREANCQILRDPLVFFLTHITYRLGWYMWPERYCNCFPNNLVINFKCWKKTAFWWCKLNCNICKISTIHPGHEWQCVKFHCNSPLTCLDISVCMWWTITIATNLTNKLSRYWGDFTALSLSCRLNTCVLVTVRQCCDSK